MNRIAKLAAVSLPALLSAFSSAQPYSYIEAGHYGDSVNRSFYETFTKASRDQDVTTLGGSTYVTRCAVGLNWARLFASLDAYRTAASPTLQQAYSSVGTWDQCEIKSEDYPDMPLKLYMWVDVSGTGTGQTYANNSNVLVYYKVLLIGQSGASGYLTVQGQWDTSGYPPQFAGTPPGLIRIGPLDCIEDVPFLMHLNYQLQARVFSNLEGHVGMGSIDFYNTFRVKGVEITDSNGNPVTRFRLVSGLGIDYTKAANPATLTTLKLSDNIVVGGTTLNGRVVFDHRAEQGGQTVYLKARNALATVPGKVVVPYLSDNATFTIQTSTVAAMRTVDIIAKMAGVTKIRTLTLKPPPIF